MKNTLCYWLIFLTPCFLTAQQDITHYENYKYEKNKNPEPKPSPLPPFPLLKTKKQEIPIATELIEINGMVMHDTRTRGGYDFYLYFTRHWAEPQDVPNYNIVINEFPGRGRTIKVGIAVNEKQVFTRTVQPSAQGLEDLARALADYIYGYVTSGKHVLAEEEVPEYSEGRFY